MNAAEWVATYRATEEDDRAALLREGLAREPELVPALVAWATEFEGIEPNDYWLFSDLADLVDDGASKGALKVAEAELRWADGDSTQNVLECAIEAIGHDANLPRGYEIVYELLINYRDLVWEDAFERIQPPPDAIALLRHLIDRAEARSESRPAFLPLAPAPGDETELRSKGLLAEALAARRAATGEDFASARRAVFSPA